MYREYSNLINNNVWANSGANYIGCVPWAGDISGDPLFYDEDLHRYELLSLSPNIDSGDSTGAPVYDYRGNFRYDDAVVDSGAGSITYYDIGSFEYPGRENLRGDLNYDGSIDLTDAVLGMQVITGVHHEPRINPDGDIDDDSLTGMSEILFIMNRLGQ